MNHSVASSWSILCDFDGTIALEDVTDSLLERFAPGWEAIETEWRLNRIGSRECMARQVALINASQAEIDEHLAQIHLDPHFPAFVHACLKAGHEFRVVSDGIDYAIKKLLGRLGLEHLPLSANCLVATGARSWRLEFPFTASSCRMRSGNCKCVLSKTAALKQQRVLVIGDGRSDFCVAGTANLVFAKQSLIHHCASIGVPHFAFTDFSQALGFLQRLDSYSQIPSLVT